MIHIASSIYKSLESRLRRKRNKYRLSVLHRLYFRFRKNYPLNQEHILGGILKYNCAPYWFKHSYSEIFEQETYKFSEPSNKKLLIIDCGSNIGLSILYYKLNYPNAKVIGFEADPSIFKLLKDNLEQYNFDDIMLYNKAVWTESGFVNFNAKGGMAGSIETNNNEGQIKVETSKLKDFLDQPVDFLKIDIEGAELPVLNDCAPLLSNVRNMFVEYHCNKEEPLELSSLLNIISKAGFRYYIRQAYENLQYPFIEKHGEYMDIQLNIFCFR